MPVSVEVKYEYFFTWGGRIKIIELVRISIFILDYFCATDAYNDDN